MQKSPSSLTWPDGVIDAAPQWLKPKSPLPLRDQVSCETLASELNITLDRLEPLIAHRYLRVIQQGDSLASTIVGRPRGAAFAWLRTMFMPLPLRPFLTIDDVADLFKTYAANIRYLCVTGNIPIYADPVFGELLSVAGFRQIRRMLFEADMLPRFDRGCLMNMIGLLRGMIRNGNYKKPMPYVEKIEREIARIAALPEPQRGEAAFDFWNAYQDARKVTDSLRKYFEKSGSSRARALRRTMMKVKKMSAGQKYDDSASAS